MNLPQLQSAHAAASARAQQASTLYAAEQERILILANLWDNEAEAIFWNIPDDSTPENVTLSLTQLSEAYTLKTCADELRAALTP